MEPMTAAISLLAAFGLAALLWLFLGHLLLPVGWRRPVRVQVEPGPELEQTLRGLHWLNTAGLLEARVSVMDPGLLPEERMETLRLLSRWPGVELLEERAEDG